MSHLLLTDAIPSLGIAAAGAVFPSDADPLMISVGLVRPKALRDGVRFATLSLRLALAFVWHDDGRSYKQRPGIGRPAAMRRRLGLLRPQNVLISGGPRDFN